MPPETEAFVFYGKTAGIRGIYVCAEFTVAHFSIIMYNIKKL